MIMNKDWFKNEPRVPAVKKYLIVIPYEREEGSLNAAWGKLVEVSREKYMSTDRELQDSVRTITDAVTPYKIIEDLLEKHINKTVVNQHTRDGKLNSLSRAVKSYKANYQSLIDILDKQIESKDYNESKYAKSYKESIPTIEDVDNIQLEIDAEKKARNSEKVMLEREIKRLRRKIEENLKLEEEIKLIEIRINNL